MPSFRIKKQKPDFTLIPNSLIDNPDLSMEAKGLYMVILAAFNGKTFDADDLVDYSADPIKVVISSLEELEKAGYLK